MNSHTVKAFDEDIERLRALTSQLGGRAETALANAVTALLRRDDQRAASVVMGDRELDEMARRIERRGIELIALRAPMADDLRVIFGALKIAMMVERIGDYARNIARRAPMIRDLRPLEGAALLPAMAEAVSEMVTASLDAFVRHDAAAALAVRAMDDRVDRLYDSIVRALIDHMIDDPRAISASAQLLFVAQNLERVGDHASHIAGVVHYAVTGQHSAAQPPTA